MNVYLYDGLPAIVGVYLYVCMSLTPEQNQLTNTQPKVRT